MIVDRSPRVRLRDVTVADADLLDDWSRAMEGSGGFNDFGQRDERVDREALAKGPFRDARNGTLIVERVVDGLPIGTVGWHEVRYGPNPESSAWNIGIELISSARGFGFGAEAQRLLAELLFSTTGVNRVEAATDIDNIAEQRSLEKAGFGRDGIIRGAQFRHAKYRDLIVYARLRGDPA